MSTRGVGVCIETGSKKSGSGSVSKRAPPDPFRNHFEADSSREARFREAIRFETDPHVYVLLSGSLSPTLGAMVHREDGDDANHQHTDVLFAPPRTTQIRNSSRRPVECARQVSKRMRNGSAEVHFEALLDRDFFDPFRPTSTHHAYTPRRGHVREHAR